MAKRAFDMMMAGLGDAVAYVEGDASRGRVAKVKISGDHVMTDEAELRQMIAADLSTLDDPTAIRDSFAIAQQYAQRGVDLEVERIQEIVLEAAKQKGFTSIG